MFWSGRIVVYLFLLVLYLEVFLQRIRFQE